MIIFYTLIFINLIGIRICQVYLPQRFQSYKISVFLFISDEYKISCPRCRYIMHHACKSVRQLPIAKDFFLKNICEHCQAKTKHPKTKKELIYSKLKSEDMLLRQRKKEIDWGVSLTNIKREIQKSTLLKADSWLRRVRPLLSSLNLNEMEKKPVVLDSSTGEKGKSSQRMQSNISEPEHFETDDGFYKGRKKHLKDEFHTSKDLDKNKTDLTDEGNAYNKKREKQQQSLEGKKIQKDKFHASKDLTQDRKGLKDDENEYNKKREKRQGFEEKNGQKDKLHASEELRNNKKRLKSEENVYDKKREKKQKDLEEKDDGSAREKKDKEKTIPGIEENKSHDKKNLLEKQLSPSEKGEVTKPGKDKDEKEWYLTLEKDKEKPSAVKGLPTIRKPLPVSKEISGKESTLSPHEKGLQKQGEVNKDKSYKESALTTSKTGLIRDEEKKWHLAPNLKETVAINPEKKLKTENMKVRNSATELKPLKDKSGKGVDERKALKSKGKEVPTANLISSISTIKLRRLKQESIESRDSLQSKPDHHRVKKKEKSISADETIYKNEIIKKPTVPLMHETSITKEREADIVHTHTFTDDVFHRTLEMPQTTKEKGILSKVSLIRVYVFILYNAVIRKFSQ